MSSLVYYESIKGELKIKSIYECRCDERLQTKTRKLRVSHTLGEVIGAPSRLRLIHKDATFGRISPHFDFSIEENAARRKWKYDDPKFD